MVAMKLVKN
jgi:dual specificity tyrosine-phosphorylation-regulated kinase 2/3/4